MELRDAASTARRLPNNQRELIPGTWLCLFLEPGDKEREERADLTPVDLLIGWRKVGASNTLAGRLGVHIAP